MITQRQTLNQTLKFGASQYLNPNLNKSALSNYFSLFIDLASPMNSIIFIMTLLTAIGLSSYSANAETIKPEKQYLGLSVAYQLPASTTIDNICCQTGGNLFTAIDGQGISIRMHAAPIWVKIRPLLKTGILYLSSGVDRAELYRLDNTGKPFTIGISGDHVPASSRSIVSPKIAFAIDSNTVGKNLFLRLEQQNPLFVTLNFVSSKQFENYTSHAFHS